MKKILVVLGLVAGGMLVTGSPGYAAAKADSCAAYAYQGTDTTICDLFPGSKDRDCPELKGKVYLVSKTNDPWKLDRDKDGIGCEGDDLTPVDSGKEPANPGSDNDGGAAAPTLPKTGPDGPAVPIAIGGGAVVVGAGAFFLMARRRVKFSA